MYQVESVTSCPAYCVKATEKLIKSKPLVLILRNNHDGFITFTINTLQP